ARDMARAWPRIQYLALDSDRSCRIKPQITLNGLLAFATHCPFLQSLSITFDATIIPKLKGNARYISQHSLEELDVAHSPVGKPCPVAKFLCGIFPHLTTITTLFENLPSDTLDRDVAASHKSWKKVQNALWNY
ncbi:hypothetical protein B0H16DRAFT_1326644, partial [Mycena metata]